MNGTLTVLAPGTSTAKPVIYPAAGHYSRKQSLVIADVTAGAATYYTTDGSIPTAGSTRYTTSVSLAQSETVNAIAISQGVSSLVATVHYEINLAPPLIDFSGGSFETNLLVLHGAKVVMNSSPAAKSLQLTDGGFSEARSAWFLNRVPVTGFTTDFTFEQKNAIGDGFTFTIQNTGLTAVGSGGGGLGYQGIRNSVAIKFDLYNNSGEGIDSTGLYTGGAAPYTPATNLSSSGINLRNGNVMLAHLTYDGSTLVLTLTDTTTLASMTKSFSINIPAIIGGSSAYVGFTGGTGGATAIQNILSWAYDFSNEPLHAVTAPAVLPLSGTYDAPFTVSMEDSTPGASIYYSMDGSIPTASSTLYKGSFLVNPGTIINAIAISSGYENSGVSIAEYPAKSTDVMNYPAAGFTSGKIALINGARIVNGALQITDGGVGESRSAWYADKVPVSSFTTDFTFQQRNATADGFTFTIHNASAHALGTGGGGLGYQGIPKSVAIKFDLYNNTTEGANSTGL